MNYCNHNDLQVKEIDSKLMDCKEIHSNLDNSYSENNQEACRSM